MTRRRRGFADCRGFTLLEVVAAFAILALSLGALYQVFATAAQRVRQLEAYDRGLQLAEAELARLASGDALTPGSLRGEHEGRYRWRGSIERFGAAGDGAPEPLQPYRVTVEVSWGAGGQESGVALTTVRLGP